MYGNLAKSREMILIRQNVLDSEKIRGRNLSTLPKKISSRFYVGALVTRTGDREIRFVSGSGSLQDNPGHSRIIWDTPG